MSCERRTYITPPNSSGIHLPPVPTSPDDWQGLVTFLDGVKDLIEHPDTVAPTPGIVPNFALEEMPGGCALTWEHAENVFRTTTTQRAGAYILYRGKTNDWRLSKALVTPHDKNVTMFRWFDKWGQAAPGTERFYWVQALNQMDSQSIVKFARGPLTGPLHTVEP